MKCKVGDIMGLLPSAGMAFRHYARGDNESRSRCSLSENRLAALSEITRDLAAGRLSSFFDIATMRLRSVTLDLNRTSSLLTPIEPGTGTCRRSRHGAR